MACFPPSSPQKSIHPCRRSSLLLFLSSSIENSISVYKVSMRKFPVLSSVYYASLPGWGASLMQGCGFVETAPTGLDPLTTSAKKKKENIERDFIGLAFSFPIFLFKRYASNGGLTTASAPSPSLSLKPQRMIRH